MSCVVHSRARAEGATYVRESGVGLKVKVGMMCSGKGVSACSGHERG